MNGIHGRLAALAGVIALLTCNTLRAEPALHIVATTGMVGDVVQAVAGEHASVDVLMGAGVDPHLYKATRSDMARMLKADAVFYNGLLLEGKLSDALISVARRKPVYALTSLLDEGELLEPDQFEGHYDPHVWMDPLRWRKTVDVVRRNLTVLDPSHASDFERNARAYEAKLDELHRYASGILASVPADARVLVTAHDAFNYFADRYGFEVVGIQGISTESEAGVRDIEAIVDLIVSRRIPAVFMESTVSDRNVRALQSGARAKGAEVVIGGELFSDAMGPPGTYEGTYVGMIDHNVTTIVRALGGRAPAGGMSDRLSSRQ